VHRGKGVQEFGSSGVQEFKDILLKELGGEKYRMRIGVLA
jgi:hypothetical protein